MSKKKDIEQAKHDCNKGKGELMKVWDRLESIGAMKEFEQLGKIIARLEAWQNR